MDQHSANVGQANVQLQDGNQPSPVAAAAPGSSLAIGRYRSTQVIIGLGLIAGVVAVSALLDASPWTIFIAVVAAAVVIGTLLITWQSQRWEQTMAAYADGQEEIQRWQQKWEVLHSDARQTATAFSHMLDGLVMVAPDGTILLINDSARRLLALSRDSKLLGRRSAEVIRIPEVQRAIDEAAKDSGHRVTNIEIVDGTAVRPLRVQVDRIEQAGSSRMLLMFRDETETKRVEQMRREFIANISHELKTPLAAVKGYAETVDLAIKDDPEAALHFMGQIHTQCLRLERLIADMMKLARAQSGSQFMDITQVKMEDIIADALKSYRPLAESKSITLTVQESEQGALVHADTEALLTITNNLIGNAIRYTPNGGHVCVSCQRRGDYWALIVADNGVGIPLKDQDRIFERFYRVDKARESEDGGTGIGLSIVKNLALALDGKVAVTSSPNEGATFEVQLPAADESSAAVKPSESSQLKAGVNA